MRKVLAVLCVLVGIFAQYELDHTIDHAFGRHFQPPERLTDLIDRFGGVVNVSFPMGTIISRPLTEAFAWVRPHGVEYHQELSFVRLRVKVVFDLNFSENVKFRSLSPSHLDVTSSLTVQINLWNAHK